MNDGQLNSLSEHTSILKCYKDHYIITDIKLWKGMVGNMDEKNFWDIFIVSGKVEDYLKYVAHNKSDTADMGDNIERNGYAYRDGTCFITS